MKASGGKVGRSKDWRGIWATWACEGATGAVDVRAEVLEERYCDDDDAIFVSSLDRWAINRERQEVFFTTERSD